MRNMENVNIYHISRLRCSLYKVGGIEICQDPTLEPKTSFKSQVCFFISCVTLGLTLLTYKLRKIDMFTSVQCYENLMT